MVGSFRPGPGPDTHRIRSVTTVVALLAVLGAGCGAVARPVEPPAAPILVPLEGVVVPAAPAAQAHPDAGESSPRQSVGMPMRRTVFPSPPSRATVPGAEPEPVAPSTTPLPSAEGGREPEVTARSVAPEPGHEPTEEPRVVQTREETRSTQEEGPPPYPATYEPVRAEDEPQLKRVAAAVAYDLTNYDVGEATDALERLAGRVIDGTDLAVVADPLLHDDRWSRGEIVYPQLGGLKSGRASVMVVVRQSTGTGSAAEHVATRTLDIRLVKIDGTWRFERLDDAGGIEIDRPDRLSRAARSVLDDPRIYLPDSAKWDIYRGTVSATLLRVMARLADETPFAVLVLTSGHPDHVFETTRLSRHTAGRAVDIYAVDERLVTRDRKETSFTHAIVEWLYAQEDVANIGSPWALDGRGGRSFTDPVHHDHIHIAV